MRAWFGFISLIVPTFRCIPSEFVYVSSISAERVGVLSAVPANCFIGNSGCAAIMELKDSRPRSLEKGWYNLMNAAEQGRERVLQSR